MHSRRAEHSDNPYVALGLDRAQLEKLPPDESMKIIGQAYRGLAIKYHPDKNPGDAQAEREFKRATDAFAFFQNPGGDRNNRFFRWGQEQYRKAPPSSGYTESDSPNRKGSYAGRSRRGPEVHWKDPTPSIVTNENYRQFFNSAANGAERFRFEQVSDAQWRHDAGDPEFRKRYDTLLDYRHYSNAHYDQFFDRRPSREMQEAAEEIVNNRIFKYHGAIIGDKLMSGQIEFDEDHVGYCPSWKSPLMGAMLRISRGRKIMYQEVLPENLTQIALSDSGDATHPWRRVILDYYLISNLDHADPSVQAEAVKALARQTGFMDTEGLSDWGKNTNICADLLADFCQRFRGDLAAAVLAMDPKFEFVAPSQEYMKTFPAFSDYMQSGAANADRLPPPPPTLPGGRR